MSSPIPNPCWNPTPHGDSIRRRGLWEVIRSEEQSPVNGISALIRKGPESSLLPPTL